MATTCPWKRHSDRKGAVTILLAMAAISMLLPPVASGKGKSVIITAQMRENAQRNCEKHPWMRQYRDRLAQKLEPWLELSDEALWRALPSQAMPRSSVVELPGGELPDPDGRHSERAPFATRGFGMKSVFTFDPFENPWKIQDTRTGEWFPKNEIAAYYESALDPQRHFQPGQGRKQFLTSGGPEGTQSWVDDGTGMVIDGQRFFPVAHYAFRLWTELIDVTQDLAELYTLTNDERYARKAGILLDRMADLYPAMDYGASFKLGMEASTGGTGKGRVQGAIWETWTAQKLSLAYDWIYDALIADQSLADFSREMAERYQTQKDKGTPQKVVAHIEKNLIREFVAGVRDRRIEGNAGMHQYAMAAAAIALDDPKETPLLLDWLFEPHGGKIPAILVNELSRDGLGLECGLGYAGIPPRSIFEVARLLEAYPSYSRGNLLADYPKFRNSLSAGERTTVAGGSILHWGDGGGALGMGEFGYPVPLEMALRGYQLRGELENLREVLNAAAGDPDKVRGDFYAEDPEAIRNRVAKAAGIEEEALRALKGFNSGGVGFSVLQSPYQNRPRMVALNYGPMSWGHGHADRLGLHLISDGVYMATDLGYPTTTFYHPPRIGWTSHTASHNTVMVDDTIMERNSSFSGKARLFAEAGPVRVMDIDGGSPETLHGEGHSRKSSKASPIYPQCKTYRRAVVMVDVDEERSYYLDLFWIRGGKTHRLIQNGGGHEITSDWPEWRVQESGTLAGEKVGFGEFYDGPAEWTYQGSGLMYLDKVKRAQPDRPFYVDWQVLAPYSNPGGVPHFRVHNLTPLDEAATADGRTPSGPVEALRYLVRTIRGKASLSTQFLSVLEPYSNEPFISSVRLIRSSESQKGFHAIVEVTFKNGGRDLLLVNENDAMLEAEEVSLVGRVGWCRFDGKGERTGSVLLDGRSLQVGGYQHLPAHPSLTGSIVSLDERDPDNVLLHTGLEELPESAVGCYIIINNRQRADASYAIKAILPGGIVNIGCAALDELFMDDQDYSKGAYKNISRGDQFHIANHSFQP